MTKLWQHPFKEGIRGILEKHFADEIAKRFVLLFEGQIYNKHSSVHIWKQLKDDVPILEVRYMVTDETSEYICDMYPWDNYAISQYRLLRYITDKVKAGKIGRDWDMTTPGGRISLGVQDGRYETPDEIQLT